MENSEQLQMKVGDVVSMEGNYYRILVMTVKFVTLVQLEIERLNIIRISMDFLKYQVTLGELKLSEWNENRLLVEKLTEKEEEELNQKVNAIERVLQQLYPAWERLQSKEEKPEIKNLAQELKRSKSVVYRLLRQYLQSGRDRYSLIDGRKGEKNRRNEYKVGDPVRGCGDKNVANDEQLEMIFQDGYQYFIKGKERGVTLMAAYRYLVGKYYTHTEYVDGALIQKMLPITEIPTYKRFWHYCNKQNNGVPISKLKISARERRNNERPLHGNSQSGCSGPGHIVEVDEVEIDMINVSTEDSRQIVGRAVMYLAIDVYSCCIVACWVDYANNSFVGLTNLLMSLFFDAREQYKKYGLDVPPELCPSGFIPLELRTDHGAEYTSEDVRRIGREIGMNITLVPPATGSMKGLVEQAFHQFQEIMRGAAGGTGVILKRYDSKHYETACTNIDDIRQMAYRFVIYYNQHKRDGYPLTRDMIQSKVLPIPASIWQYGCEQLMTPRWITDSSRKNVFFALLKTDRKFQISRRGITYHGLFYENGEKWLLDKMWKTGQKKEKIDGVRYDPRSINHIYIMEEGILRTVPLNEIREEQRTFKNMNWKEYDSLWQQRKNTSKGLEEHDLAQSVGIMGDMSEVIAAAKRLQEPGKNRKKNIREARKQEQAKEQLDNTLAERMHIGENKAVNELPEHELRAEETEPDKKEKIGKTRSKAKTELDILSDSDYSGMEDFFGV